MRTFIVATGITLILAFSLPIKTFSQDQLRRWSSRNGDEAVEASFRSFDPKTKSVSLQLENGESLQVSLKHLSRADQRYISNIYRNKAQSPLATADENPASVKHRSKVKRYQSAKAMKAFGIDWTPGIQSALQIATAGESDQDDQPVMWLRVLGDLKGFM